MVNKEHFQSELPREIRYTITKSMIRQSQKRRLRVLGPVILILIGILAIVIIRIAQIGNIILIYIIAGILFFTVLLIVTAYLQTSRSVPCTYILRERGFTCETPRGTKSYQWDEFAWYSMKSRQLARSAKQIRVHDKASAVVKEGLKTMGSLSDGILGQQFYLYRKEKQALPSVYIQSLAENSAIVRAWLERYVGHSSK